MKLTEQYSKKLNTISIPSFNNFDGILLQLELTNACNHKCIFCPNKHHTRPTRMMEFSLAESIIKECANFLGRERKICFHMNGEPLLYKEITRLITLSKVEGYSYIFLTTNGSLATHELLSEIFEAGLDSIKFSINAGTPKTYRKIHGADDFDKVMEALRFAAEWKIKHNPDLKIFVSCVGIKENRDTLHMLKDRVSPFCDEVVFYYPCTYAGQESVKNMYCDLSDLHLNTFHIKHDVPCSVLWNSINVTAEGYLSICCSEADNRLIVEDLKDIHIRDAWLGERMQKLRQKHVEKSIEDTPCASCIYGKPYEKEKMSRHIFDLALKNQ